MKQYEVSEAMTDLPAIIEAAEKGGAAELQPMDANGEYRRLQPGETAGRERPERDFWNAPDAPSLRQIAAAKYLEVYRGR